MSDTDIKPIDSDFDDDDMPVIPNLCDVHRSAISDVRTHDSSVQVSIPKTKQVELDKPSTWYSNVYGILGLLVSITSCLAWFLLEFVRNDCVDKTSVDWIQAFHVLSFVAGVIVTLFGLFNVGKVTYDHVSATLVLWTFMFLSLAGFYSAYGCFWLPCLPEVKNANNWKVAEGDRRTLGHTQLDLELYYHGINHDDHHGHASNASRLAFDNVFAVQDTTMIAVYFLDIATSSLLMLCAIFFFNNI